MSLYREMEKTTLLLKELQGALDKLIALYKGLKEVEEFYGL